MNFHLKSIPLAMLALALCASLPACGSDDDEDCNGLDERGVCDGNVAKFCLVNTLVSEDCAKSNMLCDMDPVDGAYCTNRVEEKGDCGSITFEGLCEKNILKRCETSSDGSTKLVTTNCAATGDVCDPIGYLGSASCAKKRNHFDWEGKPCADHNIDSLGCLDNSVAICSNNSLWLLEACVAPATCQTVSDGVLLNFKCM